MAQPKAKKVFWKKSLDAAIQLRFLKNFLSLLPPDEDEAIAATREEIARLTTELRKTWGAAA